MSPRWVIVCLTVLALFGLALVTCVLLLAQAQGEVADLRQAVELNRTERQAQIDALSENQQRLTAELVERDRVIAELVRAATAAGVDVRPILAGAQAGS